MFHYRARLVPASPALQPATQCQIGIVGVSKEVRIESASLLERFVAASAELTGARYGAINIVDDTGTSITFVQTGVDPATVGAAVRMLVEEDRADHVDLNFGCPVPKVTRRGGGAVLPWKRDLFAAIVESAVAAAAPAGVPVTVKMCKGVDDDHLTYVEAGLRAQEAGVAARPQERFHD